jgi:hypothetical protein
MNTRAHPTWVLGGNRTLESGVYISYQRQPLIVCVNARVTSPMTRLCNERRFFVSTCQLYIWCDLKGLRT